MSASSIQFQAQYPQGWSERESRQQCQEIAYNVISVVIPIIGLIRLTAWGLSTCCVLPSLDYDEQQIQQSRQRFLGRFKAQVSEKLLKTADGVELLAAHVLVPSKSLNDATVILFGGNSDISWDYRELAQAYAKEGINIVIFNYRGVNLKARGEDPRDRRLVLDGDAVFQLVNKQLGVPSKKIILHGFSLGGMVASEVAKLHPRAHLCSDRSSVSMKHFMTHCGCACLAPCLPCCGWDLGADDLWKQESKGKRWVIFGEQDQVMDYPVSVANVVESSSSVSEVIKVKGLAHSGPIQTKKKAWKRHMSQSKLALESSSSDSDSDTIALLN